MTTTFWPMEHLEVQTQHSLTTTCCNFVHQRYIGMQNLRLLMGVGFVAAAEVNSNPRNIIKIHNNVTWDWHDFMKYSHFEIEYGENSICYWQFHKTMLWIWIMLCMQTVVGCVASLGLARNQNTYEANDEIEFYNKPKAQWAHMIYTNNWVPLPCPLPKFIEFKIRGLQCIYFGDHWAHGTSRLLAFQSRWYGFRLELNDFNGEHRSTICLVSTILYVTN